MERNYFLMRRKYEFEVWFEKLTPGNQLKALACLLRLKRIESPGVYSKKAITRAEIRRGNARIMEPFSKYGLKLNSPEFKELADHLFNVGKKIRGYTFLEEQRKKRMKRICILGPMAVAGVMLMSMGSRHLLKKNREVV